MVVFLLLLYLHLFSAIEHISYGKALYKYANYYYYFIIIIIIKFRSHFVYFSVAARAIFRGGPFLRQSLHLAGTLSNKISGVSYQKGISPLYVTVEI